MTSATSFEVVQMVTRDDVTAPTCVGGEDLTITCDESEQWLIDNRRTLKSSCFRQCDDSDMDVQADSVEHLWIRRRQYRLCVRGALGQTTAEYTASSCASNRTWVATDCRQSDLPCSGHHH